MEDPLLTYINYGVLGVSVVVLILGKVVPGVLHDRLVGQLQSELEHERAEHRSELARERERSEGKDAEIARLNELVQEKVIPAIIRFTDAHAAVLEQRTGGEHRGR